MKKQYYADISSDGLSPISVYNFLKYKPENWSNHQIWNFRHPLGIYNVSLHHILRRIERCSNLIEHYQNVIQHNQSSNINQIEENTADYFELSLYAAAAHVDDVETIAKCLFKSKEDYRKNRIAKKFRESLKPIRNYISKITNSIKHNQGRIRFCNFNFGRTFYNFHIVGIFVDSANGEEAGPCKIVHGGHGQLISATSLLWEIIIFILEMSEALSDLFSSRNIPYEVSITTKEHEKFREAIKGLCRLPLYSFDDIHPFNRATFKLKIDENLQHEIQSNIWGSLLTPWPSNINVSEATPVISYRGDGATKSFKLVSPSKVQLQHWGKNQT